MHDGSNRGGHADFPLNAGQAAKAEDAEALADPIGTRDWDARAKARWDAYEATPEYAAFAELARYKSTVGFS